MAKSEKPNQFSFGNFISFINEHFALLIIILIVLTIGFVGGSLWTENQMLKSDNQVGVKDQAQKVEADNQIDDSLALDKIPELNAADHVLGAENADVIMISYLDFQCSFCQRWHPTLNSLIEKYGDQITFAYRHFTLGFTYSDKLAQASECVAEYGGEEAFWNFSNTLYEKLIDESIYTLENGNPIITDDSILTIAANAGASPNEVQACLESGEKAAVVETMKQEAVSAGIGGTPATIIISKKGGRELIGGALPIEEVEAMLEKHL
ncbi:MAG TPA: thioredoxin domain-containing protein [Candidatus Woesebacteria bacterium]|jgi:protein-disulfide isomerase|nr:thioredoxin domain-containing protein [Candidatus Woesebacteria bacterium]HPA61890.1 thioredoxin domain-containing protein [Candidatus Woesebacteria bacterium]HPR14167.1 thioredoxin domain-containing protein [Candidatus Woesebacteria bacterium]HQL11298.1 thioredoxin domain-containing protein [Candidatus Woesebacteria bacterium]HUM57057.1 thioredoxin domain-containing protein [Candidatus Woesebacteria bacterium]